MRDAQILVAETKKMEQKITEKGQLVQILTDKGYFTKDGEVVLPKSRGDQLPDGFKDPMLNTSITHKGGKKNLDYMNQTRDFMRSQYLFSVAQRPNPVGTTPDASLIN